MTTGFDGWTEADLLSCTVMFTLVEFTTLIVFVSSLIVEVCGEVEIDSDGSGDVT